MLRRRELAELQGAHDVLSAHRADEAPLVLDRDLRDVVLAHDPERPRRFVRGRDDRYPLHDVADEDLRASLGRHGADGVRGEEPLEATAPRERVGEAPLFNHALRRLEDGDVRRRFEDEAPRHVPHAHTIEQRVHDDRAGLALRADVHEDPSDVGTQIYEVHVSDGTNDVSVYVQLSVNAGVMFTSPAALASLAQGETFPSVSVMATGGTGALTFVITSGTLPTGVTLAPDGTFSGSTTDAAGIFIVTIHGTDALGAYAEQTVMIVLVPPLAFTTAETLPGGNVSLAYDALIEVVGGLAPFTFALAPTSDPLPDGLSLAEDGALTGTPTTEGSFTFTVRVADARTSMTTVDRTFTIAIDAAPMPDAGVGGDAGTEDGGLEPDAGGGATTGGAGCGCVAAGSVDATRGRSLVPLVIALGVLFVVGRRRRVRSAREPGPRSPA